MRKDQNLAAELMVQASEALEVQPEVQLEVTLWHHSCQSGRNKY